MPTITCSGLMRPGMLPSCGPFSSRRMARENRVPVRATAGWEVAYEGPDGVVLVREGLLGESDADQP